jgi:hypothetical protein
MAWLSLTGLAFALSLGLALVSRLGKRRLWQAVGVVALILVATLIRTDGTIDYRIGCGTDCGGAIITNAGLVLIDSLLIAAILSAPDRLARWPIRVALATVASLGFVLLTAIRVVS